MKGVGMSLLLVLGAVIAEIGCVHRQTEPSLPDAQTRACADCLGRWLDEFGQSYGEIAVPNQNIVRFFFAMKAEKTPVSVNLYIETNRVNILLSDDRIHPGKNRELDLFCAFANKGRKYSYWKYMPENGTLVLQATIDVMLTLDKEPSFLQSAVFVIAKEYDRFLPAAEKVLAGESPQAALAGLVDFEVTPIIGTESETAEDRNRLVEELYGELSKTLKVERTRDPDCPLYFWMQPDIAGTVTIGKGFVAFTVYRQEMPVCGGDVGRLAALVSEWNFGRGDNTWFSVVDGTLLMRVTNRNPEVQRDPSAFISTRLRPAVDELRLKTGELSLNKKVNH